MKTDAFALRHVGPRENDLEHMLKTIGAATLDQLIQETIPSDIRLKSDLDLEPAMTEYEFANHIQKLGNKNKIFQSRDLCLRALDTNSLCAKSVRRNEAKNETDL